jgi:hypothetical protein
VVFGEVVLGGEFGKPDVEDGGLLLRVHKSVRHILLCEEMMVIVCSNYLAATLALCVCSFLSRFCQCAASVVFEFFGSAYVTHRP